MPKNTQLSFDELIHVTEEDLHVPICKSDKNSGTKFTIASLFLFFIPFLNIIGLMLSCHGYNRSKDDGYKGALGLLGIFLNLTTTLIVLGLPFILIYIYTTAPYDVCAEMGKGNWMYEGEKYSCK